MLTTGRFFHYSVRQFSTTCLLPVPWNMKSWRVLRSTYMCGVLKGDEPQRWVYKTHVIAMFTLFLHHVARCFDVCTSASQNLAWIHQSEIQQENMSPDDHVCALIAFTLKIYIYHRHYYITVARGLETSFITSFVEIFLFRWHYVCTLNLVLSVQSYFHCFVLVSWFI
jgi:hypothetical protein